MSELDVPSAILGQVSRTNSLMRVQDASFDGLDLSWSYHPDKGLDMINVDTEFDSS